MALPWVCFEKQLAKDHDLNLCCLTGAVTLPGSFPYYMGMVEAAHLPLLVLAGKFLIAFPFSYHLINGIRHLVWDWGYSLTIKGVDGTGYVVLASAVALALYLTSL